MRQKVTATLLFADLALAVWIMMSPSAGSLHYAFTHFDQKSTIIQVAYAVASIIICFAIGGMFRRSER